MMWCWFYFMEAFCIKRAMIMKPQSTPSIRQENSLGHEWVSFFLVSTCFTPNHPRWGNITVAAVGQDALSQPLLTKAALMSKWLMKGDLIVLLKLFIAFICWVLPGDDSLMGAVLYVMCEHGLNWICLLLNSSNLLTCVWKWIKQERNQSTFI